MERGTLGRKFTDLVHDGLEKAGFDFGSLSNINRFMDEIIEPEWQRLRVHIVKDLRFRGGEPTGWMELRSSDEVVLVKRHPSGNLHGQFMTEEEAFGR